MKLPENIERRFLQKFCLNFCKATLLYAFILNPIFAFSFEDKRLNPLKIQFKEDLTYRVFEVKENHFCTYSGTQEGDIFIPHHKLHEMSIEKYDYISMIQGYKHNEIEDIGTLQGFVSIPFILYFGWHVSLEAKQGFNDLKSYIRRFEKNKDLEFSDNKAFVDTQLAMIRRCDTMTEKLRERIRHKDKAILERIERDNNPEVIRYRLDYSTKDRKEFIEDLNSFQQEINSVIKNRDHQLQESIFRGRTFLGILAAILTLSYLYQLKIMRSEEPDKVFDELNLGMKPSLPLRKHLEIPFKDIQSVGGVPCL